MGFPSCCPYCGGVIGRDCFDVEACGEIMRDMAARGAEAEQSQGRLIELKRVERAARRLIREGLRLTANGLTVRENEDKSDPHYELCTALEAIEPLNPKPGRAERPLGSDAERAVEAVGREGLPR